MCCLPSVVDSMPQSRSSLPGGLKGGYASPEVNGPTKSDGCIETTSETSTEAGSAKINQS